MEDAAKRARGDDLFGFRRTRLEAHILHYAVVHAGMTCCAQEIPAFRGGIGQWLIRVYVLAVLNCLQERREVQAVHEAVIDHVERRVVDEALQVGARLGRAACRRERCDFRRITPIESDRNVVVFAVYDQSLLLDCAQRRAVQLRHASGAQYADG